MTDTFWSNRIRFSTCLAVDSPYVQLDVYNKIESLRCSKHGTLLNEQQFIGIRKNPDVDC